MVGGGIGKGIYIGGLLCATTRCIDLVLPSTILKSHIEALTAFSEVFNPDETAVSNGNSRQNVHSKDRGGG